MAVVNLLVDEMYLVELQFVRISEKEELQRIGARLEYFVFGHEK